MDETEDMQTQETQATAEAVAADTQAQEASPETTQEAAPQQPTMWYDSLPEGVRDNANITKYKTQEDFARGHIALVKKLGESTPKLPPQDATPEQRAAYNSLRRGNIKSPSEYSFQQGSQDIDVVDVKQALFDAGADDYMANEVFTRLEAQWKQDEARENAAAEEICKKENNKLRAEWQEEYQVNMKANELMLSNRYQDAQKVLASTGADRFACVQMMLRDLNARAGDAQIRFEEAKHETFNDKINRIRNSVAYKNEFHPDHMKVKVQLGELFMQQAGEREE